MSSVGKHLKRLRREKGLTQEQLAELSGVKQPAISAYENGSDPLTENLIALAKALQCTLEELTGIEMKKSAPISEESQSFTDDEKAFLEWYRQLPDDDPYKRIIWNKYVEAANNNPHKKVHLDMKSTKDFASRLVSCMAHNGLSADELATASGVSEILIKGYIEGKVPNKIPSKSILLALATALRCSITDLTGLTSFTEYHSLIPDDSHLIASEKAYIERARR